ncbi:MAG TPA: carboxypeptidase regulatory-like domain-containing protein [Pyrinomonadaceae bacterium]|nr:carboxypeptidase regulatory-like domain-containing protein [Pyrinomonadaceae bacterium]
MIKLQAERPLRPRSFLIALLALFFIAPIVFAQTDTGRIVGTVKDINGGLVQGADITVKNERTGEERTAVSSESGTYIVSPLKASTYTVTVSGTNLSATINNVQLSVGQELNLDLTLQATGVAASVDVSAGASEDLIDTSSARMGANVSEREVVGLPLNGRQLSQLYLQAPGSVNTGSGTFGDIRFSGRAVEQNIVRYDGIEGSAVIDASPGNLNGEVPSPFRLQSSLENVQEFRVDSSNYPAEYGTGTGGQINVVTKSGGNEFHGSLFEYLRNDALDAANFFDNIIGKKSPLRLNQFGGSIGGPIIRDKAFFFFSYEGYRLRAGINSIETVPGQASRICAAPVGTGTIACNAAILPLISAFRDPAVSVLRVGPDLFDTVQLQSTTKVDENAVAFRFDNRFNQKHSFYFRLFRDQGRNDQPEGVTGRHINFVANPQNAVLAFQSILKPTVVNEFKVGFNEAYTRVNGVAPVVNGIDLSQLSINISGSVAGFALPGQGTNAGMASPGGLVRANSATNGRGQPYTPYSLSFIDNLNWTKGNHNYKFGGEVRLIRLYTDRQGGTTYTFSNINSFLLNQPQSIQYLGDVSAPSPFNNGATGQRKAEQEYYIAYAQDEWKIRQNLTLNYGLRYEYYTPLREARDLQILFDVDRGILRDPTEAAFKASKTNFGPRLALSWSPRPNSDGFFGGGRTVLRGGFGIFYGPGQTEDQIQPIESDRISSTLTSGPLLTFNPDQTAAINAIISNFVANPLNRSFQPRAYASEYTIPEKVYQYSFSIQQELPYKMVATIGYVGSQGRNLFLRSVTNQILPGQTTIVNGTQLPTGFGIINRTDAATGRVIAVNTVREFSLVSGTSSVNNPFAEVDYKTSGGSDSYNALQVQLARRFSTGLTLNAQYTFGRSIGNTAGSNEARTAANNARALDEFDYDRSYNNFDVRHTFNFSALYLLPVGSGKTLDMGGVLDKLLGNLEIGTIINARSGLPLEIGIVRPDLVMQCVTAGGCVVPTGAGGATTLLAQGFVAQLPGTINAANPLPPGFIAVVNTPGGGASRNVRRPDLIPGVDPYLNNDRSILNPAAFATPLPGTFGDLARNALRGPNFKQVDFILNKRIRLTESKNVELRAEFFNIFNFTNFDVPASRLNLALPTVSFNTATGLYSVGTGTQPGQPYTQSAAGGTFGLLRQTVERTVGLGTSRQIQFAVRFNF